MAGVVFVKLNFWVLKENYNDDFQKRSEKIANVIRERSLVMAGGRGGTEERKVG
jgi:hypothetical protein